MGGIGLLWFTKAQFGDFILRADFRLSSPTDNSGIFIRIPALGTSDPANDWKPAAAQGYEIQIDGKVAGWVTSGGPSPTLNKNIGLCYLPADKAALGQQIQVMVRSQPVDAIVSSFPFYKRAK